jgi:hypothetical protein
VTTHRLRSHGRGVQRVSLPVESCREEWPVTSNARDVPRTRRRTWLYIPYRRCIAVAEQPPTTGPATTEFPAPDVSTGARPGSTRGRSTRRPRSIKKGEAVSKGGRYSTPSTLVADPLNLLRSTTQPLLSRPATTPLPSA